MSLRDVALAFDGAHPADDGVWFARCPAHDDKSKPLEIREGDGGAIEITCTAGCDTSDFLAGVGLDPDELHFEREPPVDGSGWSNVPRFVSALEVLSTPPPVEIVRDVVHAGTVGVVVAESGAGKTFLLLDLAAAIVEGRHWHGRKITAPGSVAYVTFEADAFRLRYEALRQAGRPLDHLHLLHGDRPLSPVVDRLRGEMPSEGEDFAAQALAGLVADLRSAGQPPVRLLVIDTVRASLAGSEDSSENVAAYLRAVRRLLALCPDAGALLAHHAGWQDGENKRKRERGSSAFRGNVENSFYVEAEAIDGGDARLTWRTLKLRDDEKPPPLRLVRRRVELDGLVTSTGFPATSCIIASDTATGDDLRDERNRAVEAEQRAVDLRLLEVIQTKEITSQRTLRAFAGLRFDAVGDGLARLIRHGMVEPPTRQRDPYRLTDTGRATLGGIQ